MTETNNAAVTTQTFGRTVLFTNYSVIDQSNVVEVLQAVLPDYEKNKQQTDYLYKYYRGNQPILQRTKERRPEINNKVVENHAYEIVSFKVGYAFGEPVQYVRRATKSGTDFKNNPTASLEEEDLSVAQKIALLNEYMVSQNKVTQDKELAEWFFISGTGYRMVLPRNNEELANDDCPFQFDTLDPRYTAVVYTRAFGKKPVMAFQEITNPDNSITYAIYTDKEYFELSNKVDDKNQYIITKQETHTIGDIPIVEYPANTIRIGAFELVMSLLDKINTVEANRIDGIEQFIQAFMKFINVKIDDEQFEELKALGAISFSSDPNRPADIDIVTSELNQQQVQITIDHLYQMVLIICGMPDRNGTNRSTGDTGQAVILRDGWTSAEAKYKDVEAMFKKSEKNFLKIVLRILKGSKETDEIKLSDIDIKFIPNRTDNLLSKTQAMQGMLESGIHPQIAITKSGLFGDPEQVYIDSEPYLKGKWKTKEELKEDFENRTKSMEEKGNDENEPLSKKPEPPEDN